MKAILIIDMPSNCDECKAYDYCLANNGDFDDKWNVQRQKWCPLKPMPEKKEVEVNEIDDLMHTEFSIENLCTKIRLDTDKLISLGWNACLDELEGKDESSVSD